MSRTPSNARAFSDMDGWGVTHIGHVRTVNQDHFFAGGLARTDRVVAVSVTDQQHLPVSVERLASPGVAADGVGGVSDGGRAARDGPTVRLS